MTDCERTTLYFDGELPADQEATALEHLAGCDRCQAELGDWIGLETALSRPGRGAAGRVAARRRWPWLVGAVALSAAAAALLFWVERPGARVPAPPSIALAETRSIEARLTAPAFDHHRKYRVERGGSARELLSLDVLADLERRGDRAGLAAAQILGADLTRAEATLDTAPPSAARDSDRAAAALAAGDPVRALRLADDALTADPTLAPAHWNRALALDELELPLAAAAELDVVAIRGEPGWSDEARARATALRTPFLGVRDELTAFKAAADAMIAGTGPALGNDQVRRHPGLARRSLLDALAVAGSADETRALAPIAAQLDRLAGDELASRAVEAVAARDFGVRRRFQARYRDLIEGKLDDAARAAMLDELERAGDAVRDVTILSLLKAKPSGAIVARLRRVVAADDPWFAVETARRDAQVALAAGDPFESERALLGAAPACRGSAMLLPCGDLDLDLVQLYLALRRVDEAGSHLRAARDEFAAAGAPRHEEYTLRIAAIMEQLRQRDWLAAAYLEEIAVRAPDDCHAGLFADVMRASIAFTAGELATTRAHLPLPGRCGAVPDPAIVKVEGDLARLGDLADRERATAMIAAAHAAGGWSAATADLAEGRLRIDTDATRGAAQIRAALTAVVTLTGHPGTADELRAWGRATLISDAGRRSDWAGALALFGEELGRAPPTGCVVGASSDLERSVAVVRGADGVLRGDYQTTRAIDAIHADTIVPPSLVASLQGCATIAVIAPPPLHGATELLPSRLPWSFVGPSITSARRSAARRVLVADTRPPASLGLPQLAPVRDATATELLGAAATPARVRAELADAGYVEIHAHGIVDPETADAAFLVLSPDPEGRYALTAREVRTMHLAGAPVVVLAACHSAITAHNWANRWSLPDAFLAAGARAVIASADTIPDDQGAALFTELRERLARGEAPAAAIAALRADRVAHGQAWAAGLIVFE